MHDCPSAPRNSAAQLAAVWCLSGRVSAGAWSGARYRAKKSRDLVL